MKINVESFRRAIGAVIAGFGASMVAKEAYGMGCNAGVRGSLQYMVDHRDDNIVEIKVTDNT